MNRNDCDIARDLMPLSIDDVCSAGSQRFLDTHVAECKPCQNVYIRMKAGMPSLKPEPTQEAVALKQGLRWLGRRFKVLWIIIAALVCAIMLLFVAAGVQQMLLNWTSAAPLDTYTVSLYRNDACVNLGLSASFYEQMFNGHQRDDHIIGKTDKDNHTGADNALILTYTVSWFPYQHRQVARSLDEVYGTLTPFKPAGLDSVPIQEGSQLTSVSGWNSDYRYNYALEMQQLCVDDGRLYLADGQTAVQTTTGRTMLLITPGLPVSEIRITDGRDTRTIYTWGDEIPNICADWLDESGLPRSGFLSPSDLDKYQNLIIR